MPLETRIPGDPGALAQAATHLRERIGAGAGRLADEVLDQRSRLERAWEGAGGSAFRTRATSLARAGVDTAEATRASADALDRLAARLAATQHQLDDVRREASVAGLVVLGGSICEPGVGGDLAGTEGRGQAWRHAQERHAALLTDWEGALDQVADVLVAQRSNLAAAAASLLVTGLSANLVRRMSQVMKAEAAHQAQEALRHRGRAAEMVAGLRDGRAVGSLAEYDDLMARARGADELAEAAREAERRPRLPIQARGLLQSMDVLATGYGIYDDMEQGESATQAVASQAGALVAGGAAGALATAGTGALAGATIGSTVPVVGTLVGGVVGGGVAILADAWIDDRFEDEPAEPDDTHVGGGATTDGVLGLMLELEDAATPHSAPTEDTGSD